MYSSIPRSSACIRSSARDVECAKSRENSAYAPSKPKNLPVSRTPRPLSVVVSMFRGTGVPISCSDASLRARFGSRTVSIVTAMRPLCSSHHQMSTPRYRRGSRVWRPTARVTSRPAAASSSAICAPEADAPTTSTPPSGTCSGLRYVWGVSWRIEDGSSLAALGTRARSFHPVAITTRSASQAPSEVCTAKPSSVCVTDSTDVCSCTGASKPCA